MEKIKIIIPNGFRHDVDIRFEGASEPSIPDQPPVIVEPDVPVNDPPKNTDQLPITYTPFDFGSKVLFQHTPLEFFFDTEDVQTRFSAWADKDGNIFHVDYNPNKGKTEYYSYDPKTKKNTYLFNIDLIFNGKEVRGAPQGVFYDQLTDQVYLISEISDQVYLFAQDRKNHKRFVFVREIMVSGATDTKHSLYIDQQGTEWITGRLRGPKDWLDSKGKPETDPVKKDRRGVRMIVDGEERPYLYIDPLVTQHRYETNDIRIDYYSSVMISFFNRYLLLVNSFFKNRFRVPKDRPDRITGTGTLYPTSMVLNIDGGLTHFIKSSVFDLSKFMRDWPGNEDYNPEVGIVMIQSAFEHNGYYHFFVSNRPDTHYEQKEGQDSTKIWYCKAKIGEFAYCHARDFGITYTVPHNTKTIKILADGFNRAEIGDQRFDSSNIDLSNVGSNREITVFAEKLFALKCYS